MVQQGETLTCWRSEGNVAGVLWDFPSKQYGPATSPMLTVPPVSLGLHNPPSLAREVPHLGAELCPGEMPAAVLLLPSSGARIWDCPWAEQGGQGMLLPSAELAPMPLAPWDAVGAQFPLQRGTPPSCFCPAVSPTD